jgi:phosphoribosylamine-glycine ligase
MKTDNLIIFHPSSREEIEALKAFAKALKIKFEITKEKGYNKEFIDKIKRSKKQHSEGKDVVIKTEDLWK